MLNRSASALDVLCGEFPFLRAETGGAKGFACSRALSALRFTGFYFPFTGEPNVNMDSPAAFCRPLYAMSWRTSEASRRRRSAISSAYWPPSGQRTQGTATPAG